MKADFFESQRSSPIFYLALVRKKQTNRQTKHQQSITVIKGLMVYLGVYISLSLALKYDTLFISRKLETNQNVLLL